MSRFTPGHMISDGRRVCWIRPDYRPVYLDGTDFGGPIDSRWKLVSPALLRLGHFRTMDADVLTSPSDFVEPEHRFGARYSLGRGREAICVFPGTPTAWALDNSRRRVAWSTIVEELSDDIDITPMPNVLSGEHRSLDDTHRRRFGDVLRNGDVFAIYAFEKARRSYATNMASRRLSLDEVRGLPQPPSTTTQPDDTKRLPHDVKVKLGVRILAGESHEQPQTDDGAQAGLKAGQTMDALFRDIRSSVQDMAFRFYPQSAEHIQQIVDDLAGVWANEPDSNKARRPQG